MSIAKKVHEIYPLNWNDFEVAIQATILVVTIEKIRASSVFIKLCFVTRRHRKCI